MGSEAGVAIVPGLTAYCVSKHALRAPTEVIQDGHHDNGIKAWVVCPGFVDTDMGHVIPGANPSNFLQVDEVVDVVVRFLPHAGDTSSSGRRSSRAPCATHGNLTKRAASARRRLGASERNQPLTAHPIHQLPLRHLLPTVTHPTSARSNVVRNAVDHSGRCDRSGR